MGAFPYRIRLKGGRNVHGAGHRGGFASPVTACDKPTVPGDEQLNDDATITCRGCQRAMGDDQ